MVIFVTVVVVAVAFSCSSSYLSCFKVKSQLME